MSASLEMLILILVHSRGIGLPMTNRYKFKITQGSLFALLVYVHVNQIKILNTLYLILYCNSSQHHNKEKSAFHSTSCLLFHIHGELVTGCFTEKLIYLLKPSILPPAHSTPLSQKILNITQPSVMHGATQSLTF